mgnify:CR=1 FL=1
MRKNEILNEIMSMSDEERLMLIGDIKKNKLDKPKRITKKEYANAKFNEIGYGLGWKQRNMMLELADIVSGNYHESNTEVGIQRNIPLPNTKEQMEKYDNFITDFIDLMEKYSIGKTFNGELLYEYHNVLKETQDKPNQAGLTEFTNEVVE